MYTITSSIGGYGNYVMLNINIPRAIEIIDIASCKTRSFTKVTSTEFVYYE